MGEAAAAVKLTLKDHGFVSSFDALKGRVKRGASEMGQELSRGMGQGLKGGLDAVRGMASKLKEVGGLVTGIVGGIGIAGLVRDTIDSQKAFRNLHYTLTQVAGDAAPSVGQIRTEMQQLAVQTGQSATELADVFGEVARKTGDLDLARASMKAIANTSTAAGDSMHDLVEVIDGMNAGFKITKDQVPDMLAQISGLAHSTDVAMGDFAQRLERMAASWKNAGGAGGKRGMDQLLGLIIRSKDGLGDMRKGMGALDGLMDQLATKAGRQEVFGKLGIGKNAAGMNVTDSIRAVLEKTGGNRDKLEKAFGGPQAKLLTGLGGEYAKAFTETAGDVKQKTAAGLAAFDDALKQAAKAHQTGADVAAKAAEAMNDPDKKIAVAMEKMKVAFSQPQMLAAIDKLAASLPGFADAIATALDFISNNPIMSGAMLTGGVFAKGMAGGMMDAMMKGGMKVGGGTEFGAAAAGEIAKAGGPLATAFQAAPAIALAGASIAAAVEQAIKLAKELSEEKTDEQKAGFQADLDASAKARGMTRHHDEFGEGEDYETPALQEGSGFTGGAMAPGALEAARRRAQMKRHRGGAMWSPENLQGPGAIPPMLARDPAMGGNVTVPTVNITGPKDNGASSRAAAREMASVITTNELRVRIINPEDIRNSPGTVPGSLPRPG